jgi:transposase
MENLRDRLLRFHNETGESYKQIAIDCGIGINTMYSFTGGYRELKVAYRNILNEYLVSKGY